MFYDISQYTIWLLIGLLIGCVTGWMTWSNNPRRSWFEGWTKWGAIAFAIGLLIAFFDLLPGRVGHWLETALLLTSFYVVGCFLGGWLKVLLGTDSTPATVAAPVAAAVDLFAGNLKSYPGVRPTAFAAAQGADDLTAISGVSQVHQKALNDIGVYRYAHVAAWTADNAAWVDHHLASPSLVETDAWVADAKRLAAMAAPAAAVTAATAARRDSDRLPPRIVDDAATEAQQASGLMRPADSDRLLSEAASAAEVEAARQAAAKAQADRLAADAAAKAQADRLAAEAAAKAQADRLAAEASAKAEADRLAAEAAAPLGAGDTGQPSGLSAPQGAADNLKLIKGIGPKNERALNGLGVFHFSQIADWTPENAQWMGRHMAFPGRIEREHWIPQAKLLAAGMDTAHSAGVKSGAIVIDASADAPMSEAEADAFGADLPRMMEKVEGEDKHAGARPLGLASARGGAPDDLKLIKGIGKQNEARLHGLGVWHFDQIAAWSHENVKWVGSYLAFPGRIDREEWIRQARELAAGVRTEFARRVEAGLVKSSIDDGSMGQGNVEKLEPRH